MKIIESPIEKVREQSITLWNQSIKLFARECFTEHITLSIPPFHTKIYRELSSYVVTPPLVWVGTPPGRETSTPHSPNSLDNLINQEYVDSSYSGITDNKMPSSHRKNDQKDTVDYDENESSLLNSSPAIIMPREFGKSTIAMIFVLWCHLLGKKHFTVYTSKSEHHACKLIAPIKHELEHNKILRFVFGNQVSKKWTESEIELNNGSKILARGREQSVRGLKYLHYRPDLAVLDDVEDDEQVESQEQRKKVELWFDKQVLKGVDSKTGLLLPIGTILHPDSLLANIIKDKNRQPKYEIFRPLIFKALENGSSIWEEKISTAKLVEEKLKDPFTFAQERMNEPIPLEAGAFKKEYFRYYTFKDMNLVKQDGSEVNLNHCNIYTTVDLAVTDKEYSDYTVIMTVALSPSNELFVLEYDKGRYVDPDKVIEKLFNTHAKWKPKMIGIEGVGFQRWLLVNLQKAMRERNLFIPVTELKADRDKTRRISQLQPRFSNHAVFFRNTMVDLEEELLLFPRSPHDDISDALAYVLQIMATPPKQIERPKTEGTFKWWKQLSTESRRKQAKDKKSLKVLLPRYL